MVCGTDGVEEEAKTGSCVIIFAFWNTMVGSAMVSLPWSFQRSGILLSLIVSFTSFVISFYTCSLTFKTIKKDSDYIFTLKKYYGKCFSCFDHFCIGNMGYFVGIIGPTILYLGAITVYFCVIVQSLYPLLLALCNRGFMMNIDYVSPT